MDPSFIPIETVPTRTPFGLDQLRRSYKTPLTAEAALVACPAVGTADEVFPFMFLMPITTPESGPTATRVDLVYMGCMKDDGEGNPILPDPKHQDDDAVQSASSNNFLGAIRFATPMSTQYYAPTSQLTWITYQAEGVKGTAADPTGDISIITWTMFDINFTAQGGAAAVFQFFSIEITDTLQSQELVPGGQYWLNAEKKTKVLVPFITNPAPGNYFVLNAWGSGYRVGDSLHFTDGTNHAFVEVDKILSIGDISAYHATSNSFTTTTAVLPALGGSGSGASGYNINVT